MARKRSFRPRGISDSQRRKKTWVQVGIANGAVGAGNMAFATSLLIETPTIGSGAGSNDFALFGLVQSGATEVGDESSVLPDESTILRMRGSLNYPKNSATQGTLPGVPQEQFAFGMGVTDVRSLVNGASPLPITDASWDGWMFLRQSSIAPLDSEGTIVDVKSMRKIKSGDAFFVVGQGVAGGGGTSFNGMWQLDLRILLLLP